VDEHLTIPPRERPLRIGLSARLMHRVPPELGFRNKSLQYLEQSVAHWVIGSGALAYMIPTIGAGAQVQRRRISMRDYVHELDGLVLQGGADVSPLSYGSEPLRPGWAGDRVRDLYEIELLWEFIIQGKPVLGICRGAQLLNVAFGGTLYQDLPTEMGTGERHRDEALYDEVVHPVSLLHDSWLRALYDGTPVASVNSIHHQAVRKLGKDMTVEAVSPADGIIEAIRWKGSGFAIGVQWHPEFQGTEHTELLPREPLMQAFLDEAVRRRAGRR
jgi:putative glutamine amidotransferase